MIGKDHELVFKVHQECKLLIFSGSPKQMSIHYILYKIWGGLA